MANKTKQRKNKINTMKILATFVQTIIILGFISFAFGFISFAFGW